MPKMQIANDLVSKMDRVLAKGNVVGKGERKRDRGNRTLLLDRILRRALAGDVREIARRYGDQEGQ